MDETERHVTKTVVDAWMSTKDAADQLGISVRTVYALMNDGKLTAYKIGRVIRTRQSHVQECLEQLRIEPGSLQTAAK